MDICLNLALDPAFFTPPLAPPACLVVVYGAQSSVGDAYPTVWCTLDTLMPANSLTLPWPAAMQAYVAATPAAAGAIITPPAAAWQPLAPGQTFHIQPNLVAVVESIGPKDQVSFFNESVSELTVGFGLATGQGTSPAFAAPITGGNLMQLAAGPYVVLYFVSRPARVGQMIGPSPYATAAHAILPCSPALQLDLRALAQLAPQNLAFAPNRGWQLPAPAPAWAQVHPATTDVRALALQALPDR